jgi:hypothetical protein
VAPLACVIPLLRFADTTTLKGIFIMATQNAAPKSPQDTLSSYFDDSTAAVRQMFSRYAPQSPITLIHSSFISNIMPESRKVMFFPL